MKAFASEVNDALNAKDCFTGLTKQIHRIERGRLLRIVKVRWRTLWS
jgi:hypothetical protein